MGNKNSVSVGWIKFDVYQHLGYVKQLHTVFLNVIFLQFMLHSFPLSLPLIITVCVQHRSGQTSAHNKIFHRGNTTTLNKGKMKRLHSISQFILHRNRK